MKYKHLSRFVAQIFLMILVFISLASCVDANIDAQKQAPESVEDITQVMRIENADGLFSIDNGFVYFGRETCSTCNAFFPILAEVYQKNQGKI